VSIQNYFTEGKAKRYIQNAFSHYVSPKVVSRLLKDPESLSLKGEQKELTVMFCDIRGFTSISEKMDSRDLSLFMNNYLTRMSRIIIDNGGTLDKFIGDAIMAFWGAPESDPDHAVKAVRTAIRMKAELVEINRELKPWNMPEIGFGIGINTGLMNVGNFGSDRRFDYTVMGDHVNMASRLEGVSKDYGIPIILSEFTEAHVRKYITCRYIDRVHVKGRSAPVSIYEPE
jgi:adenylate cyclase